MTIGLPSKRRVGFEGAPYPQKAHYPQQKNQTHVEKMERPHLRVVFVHGQSELL